MIFKGSKKLTVISLPRGVFNPYTPTKTNIIYFEKKEGGHGGNFENVFFFVIHNDGFELNTKRNPISGESDIKSLLTEIESPKFIKARANVVGTEVISDTGNWNLRPFKYMEDVPELEMEPVSLSDNIINEVTLKIDPESDPDKDWKVLSVSQNGIFLRDTIKGHEATQKYKLVKAGDIVYNPYRVNIGSIGVVPSHFDGALVSPAYVVSRVVNPDYVPEYIVSVLRHPRYLRVIMNYSLSSARASLPYSELIRIKIPSAPSPSGLRMLNDLQEKIDRNLSGVYKLKDKLNQYTEEIIRSEQT